MKAANHFSGTSVSTDATRSTCRFNPGTPPTRSGSGSPLLTIRRNSLTDSRSPGLPVTSAIVSLTLLVSPVMKARRRETEGDVSTAAATTVNRTTAPKLLRP